MVLVEKLRCLLRAWGIEGRRAKNRGRMRHGLYLPQELEARVLLSTMTLSGTPGNDTITFQQTDATHDTFTLNGTPNTFSTAGVTAITINSGAGTDSISVLSDNSGIPLLVTGSGADTVNVGNAGSVQGILGALTLSGTTGQMTLTADDSADATAKIVNVSPTAVSGLAPALIEYTSGQLGSITLKGGTGGNTFDVGSTATGSPVTINGGSGNNALIGPNVLQEWNITGTNAGNISVSDVATVTFTNIQNLTGGTNENFFQFFDGGSVSGLITGGSRSDILSYNPLDTGVGVTVNLSTTIGTATDTGGVKGIENVYGTPYNDTITGSPLGGNISGQGGQDTLAAGSGNYTFTLNQQNTNTTVNGGTGDCTLVSPSEGTEWVISGANSGSEEFGTFTNIENLTAGGLLGTHESFQFLPGGSISGTINGGSGEPILEGANTANTWTITGNLSGTYNGMTFTNIPYLDGGSVSDTFTFGTAGVIYTITGGSGDETLDGANQTNAWELTGGNAGFINGIADGINNFTGISNLVGGTGNDTFKFDTGGFVSGTVNGGAGTNTLSYSGNSAGVTVNLLSETATSIAGGFSNISSLIGGSGSNTLVATNTTNTWNITGANSGNLNGTFPFSGIGNLTGGTANDTFDFASGGSISGQMLGGSGTNTIVASNVANTWDITGGNSGTFDGALINNIQNLTGGTANDTFAFGPAGVVTGTVDGGGGTDTLDYSSRSAGVSVNLQTGVATCIGGGVTNIENVIGSSGNDQVTASAAGGVITADGGNDTLFGSSGNVTFILASNQGTGTYVNGVSGNSTLVGPNVANTWSITGPNAGTLNGATFGNIKNLTGGTANDTFAFGPSGVVSDIINGGGGTNTLDYSARSVGVSVNLQAGSATCVGGGVTNIENVIGTPASDVITAAASGSVVSGNGGNDTLFGSSGNVTFILASDQGSGTYVNGSSGNATLVGPNVTNTWNITGPNTGTLNGATFANIKNLTGGTVNDTFAFGPSGFVAGSVNGGTGTETLSYSSRSAGVAVNLQANSATAIGGGFTNISSLIGSTGSDTLTGANTANIWNITGANSGNVNGTFSYSGIENLTGGTSTNSFAFASGGSVSGLIRGGGGIGTLDYSALSTGIVVDLINGIAPDTGGVAGIQNVISSTGNDTITAHPLGSVITVSGSGTDTLNGGPGNDTFILSATQGAGTTIAGNGGSNTIIGPNVTNTWDITSGNAGTVNGVAFTNVQNLTGGTANDSFAFGPSGFVSGAVNGGGGTDTLDYSSRSVGVVVNLRAGVATAIGGGFSNIKSLIGSSGSDILIGQDIANTWNITGMNSGNINGSFTFSSVENLTGGGGAGVDTFVLGNGAGITGSLNGGNGSGDWMDYSAYSTPVTVDLATGVATNIVGGVTNIQNVRGGNGGDTLTGNSVGNILIGGNGDDTIVGGSGRSLLIGHGAASNNDSVTGGSGNDIIIGPTTSYDSSSIVNNAALASILAEWQSSGSYATRIAYVSGAQTGGLNGTNYLIYRTTVLDEGAANTLTGGAAGMNWYFQGANDTITDLQSGEQVN